MIHQFNILIHVVAGTLGLIVGTFVLLAPKATSTHVRWGRYFLYLLSVVVITGFLGWLFFRSDPFLFLLTLLAGYNGYTGWRIVRRRERKAPAIDFAIAVLALTLGLAFLAFLHVAEANWNPGLVYSAVGALGLVTVYDIVKYLWLHAYLKKWWLYEHIYKMISPFSALLSAFAGNVLPDYQPYSQMLPNIFCIFLILVMIWRQALRQNNHKVALRV